MAVATTKKRPKAKRGGSKKPASRLPAWLLPVGIIVGALIIAGAMLLISHNRQTKTATAARVFPCQGAQANDFKCWANDFETIATKQSPEAAFVEVKAAYAQSPYVQSQCHQFVHRIGRVALKRYKTVAESYKHGDHFCSSGYYHGVMESVASEMGVDGVIAHINGICAEVRKSQPYSVYHHNCLHGLGHGIMGIEENELYTALDVCKKLTDTWEQQSCFGGVFMENIMAEGNENHPAKYLKADQPLYPCTAVTDEYKTACYLIQSSYALRINGYDFGKTFKQCAEADAAYLSICDQSVGRDASGMATSDIPKTLANCSSAPDEDALQNCAIGAVKDFIYYYHNDTKAKKLCAAFSDSGAQQACRTAAADYIKTF